MAKVRYGQKGYIGCSMSENASWAYEGGEMPKSKWSKKAMVAALYGWCVENSLAPVASFENMGKDDLFDGFFEWKSWHHTGRYAAETDFYGIDEAALRGACVDMDPAMLADLDRVRAEHAMRHAELVSDYEARHARALAVMRRLPTSAEYERAYGFAPDSLAALVETVPERCEFRTSKRSGAEGVEYNGRFYRLDCLHARVDGFDARAATLSAEDRKALDDLRYSCRPQPDPCALATALAARLAELVGGALPRPAGSPDPDDYVSVSGLAGALGLRYGTVCGLARSGSLPFAKLSGVWAASRADLEAIGIALGPNPGADGPEYMTVDQAADVIGANPRTVYKYAREGKLPFVRIGKKWLIRASSLEEAISPLPAVRDAEDFRCR